MYKKFENVVTPYYTFNYKYINEIINIFLKFYNVSYFELINIDNRFNKIFRFFIYFLCKNSKLSNEEVSYIFKVPMDTILFLLVEFNREFKKNDKNEIYASLYSDYLILQELINDL